MASVEDNQSSDRTTSRDSLTNSEVFWTSKGRKVYGGGGIRPDITIRSGLITPFTSLLLSKRLFFEFASHYASQYPTLRGDFNFFQRHFKIDSQIIREFKAFIKHSSIEIKTGEMVKDLDYIKLLLKSEIGRNFWNSDKYYQIFIQGDYQVREARKLFPQSIRLAGLSTFKRTR